MTIPTGNNFTYYYYSVIVVVVFILRSPTPEERPAFAEIVDELLDIEDNYQAESKHTEVTASFPLILLTRITCP